MQYKVYCNNINRVLKVAGPLCGCRSLAEIWALPSAGHTPSFTPHSSSEQSVSLSLEERSSDTSDAVHLPSQPSALHPSFCGVASRAAVCSQRSSRRLDSVHSKYLDRLKCLWFISDWPEQRPFCMLCPSLQGTHLYEPGELRHCCPGHCSVQTLVNIWHTNKQEPRDATTVFV